MRAGSSKCRNEFFTVSRASLSSEPDDLDRLDERLVGDAVDELPSLERLMDDAVDELPLFDHMACASAEAWMTIFKLSMLA
mmetsp:Transcript_35648/g.91674  ORF Transcript_35648/g.91674 Transcript_35648/m.91674 type:complete len:81 (-) Transcript_35648:42-284(-)